MANPGSPCYRRNEVGTLLCDGLKPDGRLCSKPMCKRHAHNGGRFHVRRSSRDGGSFSDTFDYCDECWANRKENAHASMG